MSDSFEIDRIYNEDCLEGMKRMPDRSVDCIICDLPYGTTACDWDSVIPFYKMWEQYRRVAREGAPILLFASQPFTSCLVSSNIGEFRESLVWLKNKPASGMVADKRHLKLHEDIVVFCDRGSYRAFNPQKWLVEDKEFLTQRKTFKDNEYIGNNIYGKTTRSRVKDDGTRNPISLLSARTPHCTSYSKNYKIDEVRVHPTQKPVELIRYLVRTYSNKGDVVLDNCMGSGTTAVACILEGRHYVGFETDSGYYGASLKRVEAAVSEKRRAIFDE